MTSSPTSSRKPHWTLIPARILLLTFLGTLLAFAISLLLGILGLLINAWLRGVNPNMTLAYRHIAIPGAAVGGTLALVSAIVMEIRHYRQSKALAAIERISTAR